MSPNDRRDPVINVTKFFTQWDDGHIMLLLLCFIFKFAFGIH